MHLGTKIINASVFGVKWSKVKAWKSELDAQHRSLCSSTYHVVMGGGTQNSTLCIKC